MSGPSRAEIVELKNQWRGVLVHIYPSCAPEEVCAFYADLEHRLKSTSGPPGGILRDMGRLLKSHLEKDSRGFPQYRHSLLLATHRLLGGHDLPMAKKRARKEVELSKEDSKHWLHALVPQFKDGVLIAR